MKALNDLTLEAALETSRTDLLSKYDARLMSYSGRCMGRSECLGFVIDGNLDNAVNFVLKFGALVREKFVLPEISIDNLGLGHVVYFKNIPCTREDVYAIEGDDDE